MRRSYPNMKRMRRLLKAAIYLPIRPSNVIRAIRLLRFAGWLPAHAAPAEEISRILVVQPHNSLGDLVLSIPLLDQLHEQWPKAEIDLIVGNSAVTLFQQIPYLRRIVGFVPVSKKGPLAHYLNILRLIRFYRDELPDRYDLALDPRWDSDEYAYLARAIIFLSGASIRLAYSGFADGVDPSLDAFITHRATGGRNEHESIRKLKMLQRTCLSNRVPNENEPFEVNATLVTLAASDTEALVPLLRAAGIQHGERYGILAPSASTPVKVWPIDWLAEVSRTLRQRYGLHFIAVGSSRDIDLCSRLVAASSGAVTSLAGKTSVLQLLALCRGAALFVGNDSGPAHLSGMVGTPTVVSMVGRAPSEELDDIHAPRRFRPCGPKVRLAQPDCTLISGNPPPVWHSAHRITDVSVDTVLACCEALLEAEISTNGEVDHSERGWNAS